MGLTLLSVFVIWGAILSSRFSKGDRGDGAQTATTSVNFGLKTDAIRNRPNKQVQDQEPPLPPPYLQLPMFQHSRTPLVAKEHFSPWKKEEKDWRGRRGNEKLPHNIREILLPVSPPIKKTRHVGGGPRGIVIKCKVNKMEVKVPKRLLGDMPSHSHLVFGTCQANNFSKHYLSFVYDASECGSKRMIVNNRVAYTNTLRYDPMISMAPTRRMIPITVPITCHFNRFHYSYKIGYKPKIETHRLFKSIRKRQGVFRLIPLDAQWKRLNHSDGYTIGRPMYFEAVGHSLSGDGKLYIQSCHVTASKSHTSEPRFTVIDNFGCMIDSKTSSQSRFISYTRNTVRFSVDAFVFMGVSNKHLFMHCEMTLGGVTPTESEKSCFYNHKTNRWEELHGLDSVCSCCESTCISPPTGPFAATHKMVTSGGWSMMPGSGDPNVLMPTLPHERGSQVLTAPLPRSEKKMGEIVMSPDWSESELVTVPPLWFEEDGQMNVSSFWVGKEPKGAASPLQPISTVASQQPGKVGQELMPPQSPEGERHEKAFPRQPEEKQREVMPTLWPEEEGWEPEGVGIVMVTDLPVSVSKEGGRERGAEPRWIFEEVFGLN